jgi:hypothetical protein
MHRADRIEDLARRRSLEHDASALQLDESELKRLADGVWISAFMRAAS